MIKTLAQAVLGTVIAFGMMHATALAYDIQPLTTKLNAAAPNARDYITIYNTHDRAIAVSLSAQKILKEDGDNKVVENAPDDFLITPPQVWVAPGEEKRIEFQWTGSADALGTKDQQDYYIRIEQLPIDLSPSTKIQGLQFLMNFSVKVTIYSEDKN